MIVGILQADTLPPEVVRTHGDYAAMFRRLLVAAAPGFRDRVYDVHADRFPDSVTACDGWLVTGSRKSAYDPDPWIRRLEAFLQSATQAGVPTIGICFGHQVMAQAFGGRVEKAAGGWGFGRHCYRLDRRLAWMDDGPGTLCLNALHRDQVVIAPPGATVFAYSDFCPCAGVAYPQPAISLQAHPEFTHAYTSATLRRLAGRLLPGDEAMARAAELDRPETTTDASRVGAWMTGFLGF